MTKKQEYKLSPFERFLIGSTAGAVKGTICQPLLTSKINSQASYTHSFKHEALYRGLTAILFNSIPVTAFQVFFSRFAKDKLMQGNTSDFSKVASASIAGAASACIATPAELIVSQQMKHKYGLTEITKIPASKNLGFFYKGVFAMAIREGIYSGSCLGLYPVLKKKIAENDISQPASTIATAAIIAPVAGTISHPFDTIKTLQQTAADEPYKLSIRSCADNIYKEHGIRGFFKGWASRIPHIFIGIITINTVTEKLSKIFGERSEKNNPCEEKDHQIMDLVRKKDIDISPCDILFCSSKIDDWSIGNELHQDLLAIETEHVLGKDLD